VTRKVENSNVDRSTTITETRDSGYLKPLNYEENEYDEIENKSVSKNKIAVFLIYISW